MRRNRAWTFGLLAVLIALGLWAWRNPRGKPPGQGSTYAEESLPIPDFPSNPVSAPPPVGAPAPAPSAAAEPRSRIRGSEPGQDGPPMRVDRPPRIEEYRKQLEADPHSPPPLVAQFARALSRRREQLSGTADGRARFMRELRSCVLAEGAVPSLRALCYSESRELSKRDRTLEAEAMDLQEKTPSGIRHLGDRI
jgi:hypothetical protein